ncbi:MAG TPA: LLM class flavin-dependent oxidoreductase [Streptosporangiaceae bacterium]|jgi:alkanesulfonate monooxygenase SsuD/methylene tetrahydromethanopterin reductase-like flavin-dependent oxidoreductase (luciferase family)
MTTTTRPSRRLSFGIKTTQMGASYEQILRIWRAADEIEVFEHAWLWDHMVPLRGDIRGAALEAWTLLAALAAQTRRLRLGVLVTSNRLRSPALLAKMAATTDIIAGGRLEFGIGAGGSRVAVANPAVREFEAYGVPLVSPAEAVTDLADSLTLIKQLWTREEPFDFDGRSIRLRGAVCEPKPVQQPHPPVMIGGQGDRMLRIIAAHADIWSYPGGPSPEFAERDAALRAACAATGRDQAEIARSMQLIVRAAEPDAAAAARATILAMVEAGVSHIVIAPILGDRSPQWVADEIVEPVLAETGDPVSA